MELSRYVHFMLPGRRWILYFGRHKLSLPCTTRGSRNCKSLSFRLLRNNFYNYFPREGIGEELSNSFSITTSCLHMTFHFHRKGLFRSILVTVCRSKKPWKAHAPSPYTDNRLLYLGVTQHPLRPSATHLKPRRLRLS